MVQQATTNNNTTNISPLYTLLTNPSIKSKNDKSNQSTSSPSSSYHILIQHSHDIKNQRLQSIPSTSTSTSTTTDTSQELYERAGIKIQPHHRAIRNIHAYKALWKTIYNVLKQEYTVGIVIECNNNTNYDYDISKKDDWIVINLCHYWLLPYEDNDTKNQEGNVHYYPLSNLDLVVQVIKDILQTNISSNINTIPILFDSITPIVQYHGIQNTIKLLQTIKLYHPKILLITPISVDVLLNCNNSNNCNYKILEEYCQAIISIYQGQMNIFRKSRRGTGKLINKKYEFEIIDDDDNDGNYINFILPSSSSKKDNNDDDDKDESKDNNEKNSKTNSLKYEEGQRNSNSSSAALQQNKKDDEDDNKNANIFLQDDDPDYDDWDEEDPDDDLDL